MQLVELLTNDAVLKELGRRLERHRVARNMTQEQAALEAGIGRATLQRIERGESVQTGSLVKLLRALGLLASLDDALPESIELPVAELERARRAKPRRRARAGRGRGEQGRVEMEREPPRWSWGEEGESQ